MNRREFLKRIVAVSVAVVAAPVLDLLPARAVVATPRLNLDELNTIMARHIMPGVLDSFFRNDPLLAYLNAGPHRPLWDVGPDEIQIPVKPT